MHIQVQKIPHIGVLTKFLSGTYPSRTAIVDNFMESRTIHIVNWSIRKFGKAQLHLLILFYSDITPHSPSNMADLGARIIPKVKERTTRVVRACKPISMNTGRLKHTT